jgi:hypothetical protein
MKFFYLSSKVNPDGHYEVHEKECPHLPGPLDRDYLGPFNNGREALRKAESIKPGAVCCENCCKPSFQAMFNSIKTDNT